MKATLAFVVFSPIIFYSIANFTVDEDDSADSFEIDFDEDECGGRSSVKNSVHHLVRYITKHYLRNCVNVILYDKNYEENEDKMNFDLEKMLKQLPVTFMNSQVSEPKRISPAFLTPIENECRNFILLLTDITWTVHLLGPQKFSKVVVVTVSSRWKIEEYLESKQARDIVNFLIVSYNWKQSVLFRVEEPDEKVRDINLYTHRLYVDGLGGSTYNILTSWRCGKLMRDVNLFPKKMEHGFNGRQFVVAASEQPPFTFKKKEKVEEDANESHLWDGVEIRLLRLLSAFMNYTIEIVEPKMIKSDLHGPSERVIGEVLHGEAEIGSAGVYVTNERISQIMFSSPHTTDCATFITKASTALPGHRAILGPFQWQVWLALTLTYMLAIIPLTYADSHSLRPLLQNPWEFENMFWHVFGTFTNCFTFSDKKSWTKSKKAASRLFVGWYWAFTIIVTACYTGSIVSFITLFVPSNVYDHVDQLVKRNFRIGTLSTGGWARWFNNSEHEKTKRLLRDIELVPNATQGLKNVSRSHYLPMFRPYAFLGSRAQMEFIVQTNYTASSKKKEMLHISKECFVPFIVSYVFPLTAAYSDLFNEYILRAQQGGLLAKLLGEFKWEIERTASGGLLQASSSSSLREMGPRNRKLNLADTEGMFVFMAVGYFLGLIALMGESIHYMVKNRHTIHFRERLSLLLFWRSEKFRSVLETILSMVEPLIERFRGSDNPQKQKNNYSFFKKYDSRILGTQRISKNSDGIINAAFSDVHLNRKNTLLMATESRSAPNMTEEHIRNQFHDQRLGETNFRRRKDLDVIFGSINSLPWDLNAVVHRRSSRNLESAQSY